MNVSIVNGTQTQCLNYADVGDDRLGDMYLKRTQESLSLENGVVISPPVKSGAPQSTSRQTETTIRKISSVEGLTEDEQDKIAEILVGLAFSCTLYTSDPRLNSLYRGSSSIVG